MSQLGAADVWVKHENHQPVGAFKARGGVNLVSQLGEEERERGVIAASTGNHGQSIAFAARVFGVRARIEHTWNLVEHAGPARRWRRRSGCATDCAGGV